MQIGRYGHYVISKVITSLNEDSIVSKVYANFPTKLYYPKLKHLNFWFKKKITYEAEIQSRLSRYIMSGSLVFDIGGNIGQYAMVFSYLCGAEGKVVSFEPDYNNFTFLQLNARMNRYKNLVLENKGVASEPSIQTFFKDSSTGGRRGSFVKHFVGETFKGETEEVQITTFDESVQLYGVPDFVKIDVEGFEGEVIKGISCDISNTTFIIEVRQETSAAIFNFFKNKQFKCFCIDTTEDVFIPDHSAVPRFANLLFLPPNHKR